MQTFFFFFLLLVLASFFFIAIIGVLPLYSISIYLVAYFCASAFDNLMIQSSTIYQYHLLVHLSRAPSFLHFPTFCVLILTRIHVACLSPSRGSNVRPCSSWIPQGVSLRCSYCARFRIHVGFLALMNYKKNKILEFDII